MIIMPKMTKSELQAEKLELEQELKTAKNNNDYDIINTHPIIIESITLQLKQL